MIIAIDGPSASGKSTTARCIAEILGFIHLDTGAMYRAVTLGLKNAGIATDDEKNVRLIIDKMEIQFDASNKILLNHVDVSSEIRTADISSRVSAVSALPFVREKLVKTQRLIAGENSCVLEGRDIGTVVFPNAEFKFFLIADDKIRAERRQLDLLAIGEKKSIDELVEEIRQRDALDSGRSHSPLRKADDAIEVDTSKMTINEQVDFMVNKVKTLTIGN
jgi:cytidylate kinase